MLVHVTRLRVLACVLAIMTFAACGTSDDVIRSGSRNAPDVVDDVVRLFSGKSDEAARATQLGDDFSRVLARLDDLAASRATSRVDEIVEDYALDERAESALGALVWDVTCDVVTGTIPGSQQELVDYLGERAIAFGLDFAGEAASVVGGALVASMDTQPEANDAAEACSRLPDSGI